MNYEEYFQKNPKARLVAKCMMDNMTKKASQDKQAAGNWAAIKKTLGNIYGAFKRNPKQALTEIRERAAFFPVQNRAVAAANPSGFFSNKALMRACVSQRMNKAEIRDFIRQFRTNQIAAAAGTTAAGLGATYGAKRLLSRGQQQKAASVNIPPSMRLMAHIIDGDGEWIAKLAACCKKNGKCTKVDHKQMPVDK
jgi:hypothetical protein